MNRVVALGLLFVAAVGCAAVPLDSEGHPLLDDCSSKFNLEVRCCCLFSAVSFPLVRLFVLLTVLVGDRTTAAGWASRCGRRRRRGTTIRRSYTRTLRASRRHTRRCAS